MGTVPDKARQGERHLYRVQVSVDPATWPEPPLCLTCPDVEDFVADSNVETTSDDAVRSF